MSSSALRRSLARLQRPSQPYLFPPRRNERRPALCLSFTSSVPRPHSSDHPPSPPLSLSSHHPIPVLPNPTPTSKPLPSPLSSTASAPAPPPPAPKTEKPRPRLRATKAALTITPAAVHRLRALLAGPSPQLIRIGVRSKGCAGLSYHLDYTDKPGPFDEVVEQDGVRVLIDSKALFSIIGSEMDWQEDALSAKFAFKNPNVVDACGCGESFTVGS